MVVVVMKRQQGQLVCTLEDRRVDNVFFFFRAGSCRCPRPQAQFQSAATPRPTGRAVAGCCCCCWSRECL